MCAPSHFPTDVCSTQARFSSLDFHLKNEAKKVPRLPRRQQQQRRRRRRRTRLGVNDRFDRYVTHLLSTVDESGAILIQHAPRLCVRFLPFFLSHYFSHTSIIVLSSRSTLLASADRPANEQGIVKPVKGVVVVLVVVFIVLVFFCRLLMIVSIVFLGEMSNPRDTFAQYQEGSIIGSALEKKRIIYSTRFFLHLSLFHFQCRQHTCSREIYHRHRAGPMGDEEVLFTCVSRHRSERGVR